MCAHMHLSIQKHRSEPPIFNKSCQTGNTNNNSMLSSSAMLTRQGMMLSSLLMQPRRGSRKQEPGRKGQIDQDDHVARSEHAIQNKLSASFLRGMLKPRQYPSPSASLCHSLSTFLCAIIDICSLGTAITCQTTPAGITGQAMPCWSVL